MCVLLGCCNEMAYYRPEYIADIYGVRGSVFAAVLHFIGVGYREQRNGLI